MISTNVERTLDNIKYANLLKTLSKAGLERNFLSLMEGIYNLQLRKLTAKITFHENEPRLLGSSVV